MRRLPTCRRATGAPQPARPRGGRRALAGLWVLLAVLLPAAALAQQQQPGRPQPPLSVQVITFRHQSAGDALALVTPLLSSRGEVQLRPGTNTLVVRDSIASLSRILPVLYSFDHPSRPMRVEIWLIRAGGALSGAPPPPGSGIPVELLKSLREHLQYQSYELLAQSEARGFEGELVSFDLGKDYLTRFRLGTVLSERLRLHDFEVQLAREGEPAASLVRGHFNVWLGRAMVLALAAGEGSSTALMVVVRCNHAPVEPP